MLRKLCPRLSIGYQKNGNYEQLDPADALAIVPENACMRKYFKGIDAMRQILIANYRDKENIDSYDAIDLRRIAKNICSALPTKYTSFINLLKFNYGQNVLAKKQMIDSYEVLSNAFLAALPEDHAARESVRDAFVKEKEKLPCTSA